MRTRSGPQSGKGFEARVADARLYQGRLRDEDGTYRRPSRNTRCGVPNGIRARLRANVPEDCESGVMPHNHAIKETGCAFDSYSCGRRDVLVCFLHF
jgi:hypothetical protein